MAEIGILMAIGALISWGVGDFLIQRTARIFGIWGSLLCITAPGALVLTPFAIAGIPEILKAESLTPLVLAFLTTLLVVVLQFRAFLIGKLAVVEPIMSFELPLTVLLDVILIKAGLSITQAVLMGFVFGFILLVGYKGKISSRAILEKGALLAIASAVVMAFVNLTTGVASRHFGPVVAIWFIHLALAITSSIIIGYRGGFSSFFHKVGKNIKQAVGVAVFDNAAWLFYSAAVVTLPISIAITISESYIVLAVLLGVIFNKERLAKHQWVGVFGAIVSVLVLSAFSG